MKSTEFIEQAKFNEAIVNSISDTVIVTDLNGRIVYWNKAAEELFKWKSSEVIGKNITEISPSTSSAKQAEEIMKSLKNGDFWEGEFEVQDKDGMVFPVHVKDTPLTDKNGKLIGIIGISRDIRERKKAEAELKLSEEILSLIVNESPFPIVLADTNDEKIKYWSESAKELTGYSPKTVAEWYELAYPDEEYRKQVFERYHPFVDKAKKSKKAINTGEYRITCKNGSLIDVELYIQSVPGNLVVVFNDITARKKVENSLKEQNQYLEKLNNSLQSVVFTVDVGTRQIEYVNNRVKAVFGYDPDECIGNTTDFLYPNREAFLDFGKQMQKAIQNDQEFLRIENVLRRKNGELFDTDIKTSFLSDHKVVAVISDITERKKAEQELVKAKVEAEESERQLRLISDNFVNGMIYQVAMLDENRRQFNYLSKNVEELYGCTMEEAKKDANLIYGKIHPDDINGLIEKEKEALKNMSSFESEARTIDPSGNIRWAYYISQPRIINGVVCWDGIEIDITERKKMELELKVAKEKAEESDRLKSAFLANMSHEIRTPMNGIMGFTGLLQKQDLSSEQQQYYIEIINKSGTRMLNTVNDIIEISKIETGQIVVSSTNVNISKHLQSIYKFFSLEASKKGLQLILNNELSEDESLISTDKNKLSSILTNLIKNALKFTEKGTIKIGCKKNKSILELYVEDTGIGIPENRRDAVFNRFEQADIDDKLVHEGSGLGLAITKSYVEMLGGKIWVESEYNKGSTFYFTIPYQPVRRKVSGSETITETPSKDDKKINILIVEDDETSSLFLNTILMDLARKIHSVDNGLEAVEYCKNNSDVDLVLMDLKLPILDGYQSTKKIREFNRDVVIIAQTAHVLDGDREKAIEIGCNDYIGKPINVKSLIELIQKYRSS